MFQISDWMFEVGVCVGLGLMAFALLGAPYAWMRRMGAMLLIGTTGLALWFWTGNWVIAIAGMSVWFVLPISQAIWVSRKLHFSPKRKLEPGYLTDEEFPEIASLTTELRRLDFKWEGDYWLKPSTMDQGYRLFKHEKNDVFAAIAMIRFGGVALVYMAFVTTKDGEIWLTWDYPLAYGLKMPPHFMIHRCVSVESTKHLYEQHCEFLKINDVEAEIHEEQSAVSLFDNFFASLIQYNLEQGVLGESRKHDGEIAYTWRGTSFVMLQVLREVTFG